MNAWRALYHSPARAEWCTWCKASNHAQCSGFKRGKMPCGCGCPDLKRERTRRADRARILRLDGYTPTEIAQILGCSRRTVFRDLRGKK